MMTGCRVRQERLEFALDAEEELLGCWGGTMDKSVDGCGGRARERRHDPKHGVVSQIRSSTSDASSKRNLTAILAESGPYGVAFNRDPDPPYARHWRWKVRAQPANERRVLTELALIFGDVLTNLRATLDYLVWQLVLAARNSPSDEHAFPCVKLARD